MPLFKPVFGRGGGGVVNPTGRTISVFDPSGKLIHSSNALVGTEGSKWTLPLSDIPPGSTFSIDGGAHYTIKDPTQRMQYGDNGGDPTSIGGRGSSGGGGIPDGFSPSTVNGFGVAPGYLGGLFPSASTVNYDPITKAPYNFTDPTKFAEAFGDTNRSQIAKNYGLSNDIALKELDTELAGLKSFTPAAAALKRSETSVDNQFNQAQRLSQVNSALPGVSGQLDAQSKRAEAFASGHLPNSIDDNTLSRNLGSQAADEASAGGFGAQSSVARKSADLLSVEERTKLSQYGDQLLSQNINQKAGLLLAPTEYSNAGSEISVRPTLSGSQLAGQNLSEINNLTTLNPATALSSTVQQNQFSTGIDQQTRQFNATTGLGAQEFNANNLNSFALQKFGYQVGYAGAVAGAGQTGLNTGLELQQQAQYQKIFGDYFQQAQQAGTIGAIGQGIGALAPSVLSGAGNLISSLFGSGQAATPELNTPGVQGTSSDFSLTPSVQSPDLASSPGTSTPSFGIQNTPLSLGIPGVQNVSGDTGNSFTGSGEGQGGGGGQADPAISSFISNFGLANTALKDPNGKTSQALLSQSGAVLNTAGFANTPAPGYQSVGVDQAGNALYANRSLLTSTNTNSGSDFVNTLHGILDPTGAFTQSDATSFQKIGAVASDTSLIATLDAQAASGDHKGFANTVLGRLEQPVVSSVTKDPQNEAGLSGAFTAYQLAQNWGQMSPAQKSLGIASLGIQGYKFGSGENLATKPIIQPSAGNPGLTVGQGLSLFSAGYNVYSMVKNWDQLNGLQKIAYGTGNAAQVAQLGHQFGLLGSGVNGAAVPVTQQALAAQGLSAAPQYGIGAVVGPGGATLPEGYTAVANTGSQVVAVPTATASSATGATGTSLLGTAAGVSGVAAGAYAVYKGWGTGGKTGAVNGALGGTAMAGGLYALGATNPYLLAGVVAASVMGDTIKPTRAENRGVAAALTVNPVTAPVGLFLDREAFKSGKSGDQMGRDQIRSRFQDVGLSNDNHEITLADGTVANIGVDGHGGSHTAAHPELLTSNSKSGKLSSFDLDYTNDLDYAAGMGGIALSRIINGGKGTPVDQLGNQLGNAAIQNIGYGKDMTQQNFGSAMANLRSMYSQAGIKSKADAFQLINQGFAEGRFNESDAVSAQQAANMIFDNNYGTAQKLMAGRHRGIEVASTSSPAPKAQSSAPAPLAPAAPVATPREVNPLRFLTKEQIRARNLARYVGTGVAA